MQVVQVLVAAESTPMADRLCRRIAGDSCLRLMERCSSGLRAVKRAAALRPDVIALDMRLKDEDCMSLIGELRRISGAAVVAMSSTTGIALDALDAGAADFIHIPVGGTGSDHDWFASDAVIRIKMSSIGTAALTPQRGRRLRLLVVSCARGGPVPLAYLLKRLPAGGPPVVAARRPDGFAPEEYIATLSALCGREIGDGREGGKLAAGDVVVVAPGRRAELLRSGGELVLRVEEGGEDAGSAACGLFLSAAGLPSGRSGGILLSGGRGVRELMQLSKAGGLAMLENKNALLREEGYRPPGGLLEMPLEDIAASIALRCCHSGLSME